MPGFRAQCFDLNLCVTTARRQRACIGANLPLICLRAFLNPGHCRCVAPHRTAPHRTTVQAEKLRQQLRAMEHRAGAMRADKEIFASENERLQLEYSLPPSPPLSA